MNSIPLELMMIAFVCGLEKEIIMKTLLYPLAAILLICGGVTTAQATDVYISSDNDDSAITGVIADINEDVIDIIVNGERMAVDVDALDLDNGQQDILNIGDEVRFTGEFETMNSWPIA